MPNAVIPFTCKRCATQWQRTTDELDTPNLVGFRDLTSADSLRQYSDACPNCGTCAIVEVKIHPGGSRG